MTNMLQIFLWLSLTAVNVQGHYLSGANMVVTTHLEIPYTILRDDPQSNLTGNDRYEGYIVDLVDAISKNLNFTYVLKLSDDGRFGSMDSAGRWSGMIGEVVNGQAHIAAASMTITAEREKAVDFTVPFMNSGIGVIYKKQNDDRNIFDDFCVLFYPLNNYPTDTFLLLTFVFGVILLALRRKNKTIVFRILLGIWLLFLFVFASLFIAQLSSYYAVHQGADKTIEEFSNIVELALQTHVSYGCIQGGSTESFFKNSKSPIYSKMWSIMSTSSSLVPSSAEGIERVQNGGYAFIGESTVIEYMTSRYCYLYQVGELIDSKGYGLAVKQGSPLRESLSFAILALQEQGVLSELKNKWWKLKRGGQACEHY